MMAIDPPFKPVAAAKVRGFPEAPVAMDDGSLLFVDIENDAIMRLGLDGHVREVARVPGGPNGMAIGPDGAAYVCCNGGVYDFINVPQIGRIPSPAGPSKKYHGGSIKRVDLTTKEVTILYDSFDGSRLLTPDDIVFDFDKSGGFWFTDSGIQYPDRVMKGSLYYGNVNGQPLVRVAIIPTANGVGLSPDGNTIYTSDTIFGRLWSFQRTGKGTVSGGALPGLPGNVVQTLPGYQWLDSLKIEAGGRICVGTIVRSLPGQLPTGGITVFDPDGTSEHVDVPGLFTTNLCFGGADMMDVWITSSSSLTIYKARWLRPGLKPAYTA